MKKEEMIQKWEDWYDANDEVKDLLEEEDWGSMRIGFFIALGASIEEAYDLSSYCVSIGKF